MRGKKCIASYSGGKDSVLALYRAVNAGLSPLGLITTYNTGANRSWFHGMSRDLIRKVSASLSIPITLVRTTGEQYGENFEKALAAAKDAGAQVCVFGDIDIDDHLAWCTSRCENAGLVPYFPLWKEKRKKLVYEFVDSGFSAIITVVDTGRMPAEFLAQILSRDVADAIEKSGADICGENGEYHSFAFDGPLFSKKVDFSTGEIIEQDTFRILKID